MGLIVVFISFFALGVSFFLGRSFSREEAALARRHRAEAASHLDDARALIAESRAFRRAMSHKK